MTALGLSLVGLAPGVVAAAVYWLGVAFRAAERRVARERQALADAQREIRSIRRAMVAEQPIEALKLRAAMLSSKLRFGGDTPASVIVDNAIRAGDRETLLALLQESP